MLKLKDTKDTKCVGERKIAGGAVAAFRLSPVPIFVIPAFSALGVTVTIFCRCRDTVPVSFDLIGRIEKA